MKIFFLSLGCDKNLCDSEHMLYRLAREGYEFTDDEADADIIIINTCSFIGDAKEESINEILRLSAYKTEGKLKALIAAGCLTERFQEEILEELPELDGVLGTASWDRITDVVREALEKGKAECFLDVSRLPETEGRYLTTLSGSGYLKIAEGCDKNCIYCIIPRNRGHYRSVPMEELVSEAEDLVSQGVRELILVAQETTLYGTDLYGRKALPELIGKLSAIEDLKWIRLLYCYPEEITDEMLDVIAEDPKVVHYLDIPVQHSSDLILKRMNRRTDREGLVRTIEKIRSRIPDIALRTTLITGFPGETEEDIEDLEDFVSEIRFERLGVFAYSPEEGTPAERFDAQVDDCVKEERRDRIMALQQDIAFSFAESMAGKEVSCMIEGELPDEESDGYVYAARTYMDAPDVDGMIFIRSREPLYTGDIVKAKVISSSGYDLIGVYKS
ncbi:MAG: 30S ribosomal protein S12 methylthiotransferase RimO [Lachnospiraceae bacterium]|nr:30S ribosomal protein S12 methylthiotransferase RimO [Lachnospiraceae bacterium]